MSHVHAGCGDVRRLRGLLALLEGLRGTVASGSGLVGSAGRDVLLLLAGVACRDGRDGRVGLLVGRQCNHLLRGLVAFAHSGKPVCVRVV